MKMISLSKEEGEPYVLVRKFPKKDGLKPMRLTFDKWEQLQTWIDMELPRIFDKATAKKIEELKLDR